MLQLGARLICGVTSLNTVPLPPPQPDQGNHVLRQVLANGTIITVAGQVGVSGYSTEGLPATSSLLSNPGAVAAYAGGFLVTSRGSCRVMMLWPNATLTTAAGSGACGYAGNGGLATRAWSVPQYGGLMADPWWGGWVMAEQGINVVRRVLANGLIYLVAGTVSAGSLGKSTARVWLLPR